MGKKPFLPFNPHFAKEKKSAKALNICQDIFYKD